MIRLTILPLLFIFVFSAVWGQTTADFENIAVPQVGFLNNAAPNKAFVSGNVALNNAFNAAFQAWEGWAVSKVTNNTLPGFSNQYSAIAGKGFNGSENYAVGYAYNDAVVHLTGKAAGGIANGVYVTNSTYTYFSMKDGDQFAKKFGGETGNDPDFLRLTIRKWLKGKLYPDSVTFYLADYRFVNNTQDYLVKDWQYVDLRTLGNADSLQFRLTSSDVGQFGMNTPAYFCADQFITADVAVGIAVLPALEGLKIYPNPVSGDRVVVLWASDTQADVAVFNLSGELVLSKNQIASGHVLEMHHLPPGTYFVKVTNETGIGVEKIVIE